MTKKIIIGLLFLSTTFYAQNKKKLKIEYINMTSLSIIKNTESYFTRYTSNETRSDKGFCFDLNTIHGIRFFDHVAISGGMSLDWNIDETFFSTPFIFDLRVFTSEKSGNRLFAYIQSGKNIKWSDSFNGDGHTAKMGVGIIAKYDEHISYYIDLLRKSKDIKIEESKEKGFYRTSGFGISLGVIF
jgi:hypothetical protein